jgi:hypothetical protein
LATGATSSSPFTTQIRPSGKDFTSFPRGCGKFHAGNSYMLMLGLDRIFGIAYE